MDGSSSAINEARIQGGLSTREIGLYMIWMASSSAFARRMKVDDELDGVTSRDSLRISNYFGESSIKKYWGLS